MRAEPRGLDAAWERINAAAWVLTIILWFSFQPPKGAWIMRVLKFAAAAVVVVLLAGCDGSRLEAAVAAHPLLVTLGFAVLIAGAKFIPGVGLPLSIALAAVFREFHALLSDRVTTAARAMPAGSATDVANRAVGELLADPANAVGKIPGARVVAEIVGKRMARRIRARRLSRGAR